jgi:hypothetical protein
MLKVDDDDRWQVSAKTRLERGSLAMGTLVRVCRSIDDKGRGEPGLGEGRGKVGYVYE